MSHFGAETFDPPVLLSVLRYHGGGEEAAAAVRLEDVNLKFKTQAAILWRKKKTSWAIRHLGVTEDVFVKGAADCSAAMWRWGDWRRLEINSLTHMEENKAAAEVTDVWTGTICFIRPDTHWRAADCQSSTRLNKSLKVLMRHHVLVFFVFSCLATTNFVQRNKKLNWIPPYKLELKLFLLKIFH